MKHPKVVYDCDFFIKKFEAIPERRWVCGKYGEKSMQACALGHCMVFPSQDNKDKYGCMYGEEYAALHIVFGEVPISASECDSIVATINDGKNQKYQQPTPKQRILAALYDIKKMQEKEVIGDVPEIKPAVIEHGKEKPIRQYTVVKVSESIYKETKDLILN